MKLSYDKLSFYSKGKLVKGNLQVLSTGEFYKGNFIIEIMIPKNLAQIIQTFDDTKIIIRNRGQKSEIHSDNFLFLTSKPLTANLTSLSLEVLTCEEIRHMPSTENESAIDFRISDNFTEIVQCSFWPDTKTKSGNPVKVHHKPKNFTIKYGNKNLKISLYYFIASSSGSEGAKLEKIPYVKLAVEGKLKHSDITPLVDLADELMIFLSFVLKKRVFIKSFYYTRSNKLHTNHRNIKNIVIKQKEESSENHRVIGYGKEFELLKTGFRKYLQLKSKNKDFKLPLLYSVISLSAQYNQESLIYSSRGIEILAQMYSKDTQKVSSAKLKKLRGLVKASKILNSEELPAVINQINKANQSSFKTRLNSLLSAAKLHSTHIYKDDQDYQAFFDLRNWITHTNKKVNGEDVYLHSIKAYYMLNSILLKLLGWKDLSYCPNKKYWLW